MTRDFANRADKLRQPSHQELIAGRLERRQIEARQQMTTSGRYLNPLTRRRVDVSTPGWCGNGITRVK